MGWRAVWTPGHQCEGQVECLWLLDHLEHRNGCIESPGDPGGLLGGLRCQGGSGVDAGWLVGRGAMWLPFHQIVWQVGCLWLSQQLELRVCCDGFPCGSGGLRRVAWHHMGSGVAAG